ncbi:DUF742 domain-containing protein [Actinoallomurus acanthiterrae]
MTGAGEYRDRPVRPYVITGGRAAPTRNTIRPETLLIANTSRPLPVHATLEQRRLVGLCQGLMSLAEAAAHLELPVSVTAVVASGLVDDQYLSARTPAPDPSREILQELLDGLRRL